MAETIKARSRRLDDGFFQYCIGEGLDIGCSNDPLFKGIDKWDKRFGSGDATFMDGVPDNEYDFVYSSHCLEHIPDPVLALQNWIRITKSNGYILLYVPHRDLYEKKTELPSRWNSDHKFFLLPYDNEPPCTYGLKWLLEQTGCNINIVYIKTCDYDHTITNPLLHSNGEYSIEAVIKKL